MKKFLLLSIISGMAAFASAQPTFDFESWTGSGSGIEPSGWLSENVVVGTFFPGNTQSVFQATTPDIHSGTYSAKILSVSMGTPISGLPNPIGLMATGQIVGTSLKFGFPYGSRPSTASFWFKYTPAANDSAECLISLWNGVTHDTIAIGYWKTGTAVSSFTQQNITLLYNPSFANEMPDSLAVLFSSTRLFTSSYKMCMNCGTAGSTLWVDDFSLSGWNGIAEHTQAESVKVYPNPASEVVTIAATEKNAYSLVAYDVTGRKVGSALFAEIAGAGRKGAIQVAGLPAGLYLYSIVDQNGGVIRSGKFNVDR